MKLIREVQLDKPLRLYLGKAFHTISYGEEVKKEYPVNEYTLQDVEYDFIKELKQYDIDNNLSKCETTVKQGLGYVSQKVHLEDAERIKDVLESIGLKKLYNHNDFHFTLHYDKSNPIIPPSEMARDKVLTAKAVGVELLAPDSPVPALAILFKSPDLEKRFKELEELGFKYDYDYFLAHVTIKYNPAKTDLDILEANMKKIVSEIGEVKCGMEAWRIAKT